MTSRSLRKHLTTALSTLSLPVFTRGALAGLAIAIAAGHVSAADPADNSLEKLKQRSVQSRWDHLKTEALRRRQAEAAQHESQPQPQPSASIAPHLPEPELASQAAAIQTVAAQNFVDTGYQQTTTDPRLLKKVTGILPYADYQPEMHVRTDIDPSLMAPEEIGLGAEPFTARVMQPTCFQWQASDLHHYPLYFEDPALERYGHTHHPLVQPFASVGRFSVQLVGLPYQMAIDPPCKCMYTLGWYRPGDCAPKQYPKIPWNTKAALVEAGVVTGAILALP